MDWAIPEYPRNQVDRAGAILAAEDQIFSAAPQCPFDVFDLGKAYVVVNNWRSAHSFPLNNFQNNLRAKVKGLQSDVLVVQRIKRLESIKAKLCRKATRTMELSQMQDIGGCRAIVRSVQNVDKLLQSYKRARFNHKLRGERNYIIYPKPDGYRGVHLIYQYRSPSSQISNYDNLRIELQIRSRLQHIWATAVEAVGLFTRQALKSNQGSEDWLRFFALMSSVIALMEKTAPVPGTPPDYESLRAEILDVSIKLDAMRTMQAHRATLNWAGSQRRKMLGYLLVHFKSSEHIVSIQNYGPSQSQEANAAYTDAEKIKQLGDNIVLVRVDSIRNLTRAYPNLFLDTGAFTNLLSLVTGSTTLPSISAVQFGA